jgi:hypothetical protein
MAALLQHYSAAGESLWFRQHAVACSTCSSSVATLPATATLRRGRCHAQLGIAVAATVAAAQVSLHTISQLLRTRRMQAFDDFAYSSSGRSSSSSGVRAHVSSGSGHSHSRVAWMLATTHSTAVQRF